MLTDTAVRTAKPTDKPRKLADEKGLFLLVTPSGGKWWRLKYRFGGKEKLLALGVYPAVTLKDARERREEARKLLANGADPGELRHAEWTEFDFDKAEWRIPAGKMKMKEQHIVPLSAQSVAILREIE
ncbi:MAG: integrase family protein, partial [Rhodocyclaceae bacterium]|nr:integrase family protein [Rhodocyclaceae bacterium]